MLAEIMKTAGLFSAEDVCDILDMTVRSITSWMKDENVEQISVEAILSEVAQHIEFVLKTAVDEATVTA